VRGNDTAAAGSPTVRTKDVQHIFNEKKNFEEKIEEIVREISGRDGTLG
jgi:hypothetical protein